MRQEGSGEGWLDVAAWVLAELGVGVAVVLMQERQSRQAQTPFADSRQCELMLCLMEVGSHK